MIVEPDKLRRFLSQILVAKSDKATLDNITLSLEKEGIRAQDTSQGVMYLTGMWRKSFFVSFDAGKDKTLTIPSSVLEGIKKGFGDKNIEVYTDESKIYFKGRSDKYREDRVSGTFQSAFPPMIMDEKRGLIPTSADSKLLVGGFIDMADLAQLPTADQYTFGMHDSVLTVSMKVSSGMYDKTVPLKSATKTESTELEFKADFILPVMYNLDGEVWFGLTQDGLVLSKKTDDFLVTYITLCVAVK